jgi:hypothetical protein
MPALPSVPKVLQVAFQVTDGDIGYVNINRLHFSYTGTAPDSAQLASFATTVGAAYGSAFAASMSETKTLTGVVAIDLTSPVSAVASVTASVAGTLAGTELPNDVAFVLSGTVTRRFRGGHPRNYLPLGDETKLQDGSHWMVAFVTAVETAAAGFFTAVEGAGWTGAGTIAPVNVSYYEGNHLVTYPSGRHRDVPTLRVGGPVVDAIVAYVGRQKLGTQRKRLGRS